MLVVDIMTAPVLTVGRTTPVMTAIRLLADHRVSSLPVVDEQGTVVGIVSEQDVLRRAVEPMSTLSQARHRRDDWPAEVGQLMTPAPHTVSPDADVADVAHTFSVMGWKALPVVRAGRLIGIVSRSDVVRALSRPDDAVRRDLELLYARTGHSAWEVRVVEGVVDVIGSATPDERIEATRLARSVVGVRRVHHGEVTADRPAD